MKKKNFSEDKVAHPHRGINDLNFSNMQQNQSKHRSCFKHRNWMWNFNNFSVFGEKNCSAVATQQGLQTIFIGKIDEELEGSLLQAEFNWGGMNLLCEHILCRNYWNQGGHTGWKIKQQNEINGLQRGKMH